jgi:hypothetical protein
MNFQGSVSLTLTGLNPVQANQVLGLLNGAAAETRETKVASAPEVKKAKPKKAAAPVDETDDEILDDELPDSDDMLDDDAPTPKAAKSKAKMKAAAEESDDDLLDDIDEDLSDDEDAEEISLSDVQAAFKKYMKTYKVKGKVDAQAGRKAAINILKKYKATSVDKLKKTDYASVIETLEG